MINTIKENAFIESLARGFCRSPFQANKLQESDSELIHLSDTDTIIALTTDSIVEEIESGLYTDPYLIGWMTVMVNASDLAAVGADPLGILLTETIPTDVNEKFLEKLQLGIQDACSACGIYVLGGDTNFSSRLQMGGCAIGLIPKGPSLTRVGCKPDDFLFASGPLGIGNVYAFAQVEGKSERRQFSVHYQPRARLSEGKLLREFASCCMDTSDGAIATLDQLVRLNGVGFTVESSLEEFIHKDALHIARAAGIPTWTVLAGLHGEFELLFTIPPERVDGFLAAASQNGWKPIYLGKAVVKPEIEMRLCDKLQILDTEKIRNLFAEVKGDVKEYIEGLIHMDAAFGESGT